MTPRNSPSRTSRLTSATIVAPPMSSPRFRVARIGAYSAPAPAEPALPLLGGSVEPTPPVIALPLARRERSDRGLQVARRERLHRHRLQLPLHRLQLHREHRLQQRVVLLADPVDALRPDELEPLQRR